MRRQSLEVLHTYDASVVSRPEATNAVLLRSDLCRSQPSGRLDLWAIGALMRGQHPEGGQLTFILQIHSQDEVLQVLEDDLERSKWMLRGLTFEEHLRLMQFADHPMEILAATLQVNQILISMYSRYHDQMRGIGFAARVITYFQTILLDTADPCFAPLVEYVVAVSESPFLSVFRRTLDTLMVTGSVRLRLLSLAVQDQSLAKSRGREEIIAFVLREVDVAAAVDTLLQLSATELRCLSLTSHGIRGSLGTTVSRWLRC